MSFRQKGSQTAEEYSKDDLTREKLAVSLYLGGQAFMVPPKEAQGGIRFTRNFVNVGLPFQSLAKANTKIWC